MKKAAFYTVILCLSALFYTSCKEDEYMDWKLLNDRWYLSMEDSLKKVPNFYKTSTGLYYKVIYQGNDRRPNDQDKVKINITGKLVDGSVLQQPVNEIFSMSQLVSGVREGIRKMQHGGHYILYLPSDLGYKDSKNNPTIPPYSVLKFDITLLDSGY